MPLHRRGVSTHRGTGIGDPQGGLPNSPAALREASDASGIATLRAPNQRTRQAVVWVPYVGFHPLVHECRQLADKLVDEGFGVFMPLMFGEFDTPFSAAKTVLNVPKLCIQREFRLWARDGNSPILGWLRELANEVAARSGRDKVGAIGMCLTGNFALSLIAEPTIEAAVGSQPSLPLFGAGHAAVDQPEQARLAAARLASEHRGPALLGYRFEDDGLCKHEKFDALNALFGETFRGVEIPGKDHAMLTAHFALPHDRVDVPPDLVDGIQHMVPIRSRIPVARQEEARRRCLCIVEGFRRTEGPGYATHRAACRARRPRYAKLPMRRHRHAWRA